MIHTAITALSPLPLPSGLLESLERAYATPPRAYHSLEHVLAVVGHWRDVGTRLTWHAPRETYLALLFHDAVYDTRRTDNEERSADLALSELRSLPGVDLSLVTRLIRLTARHGQLEAAGLDHDSQLFLDCDLAILGAPPAVYDRYEAGIRSEYAQVPEAAFRSGRAGFIQQLLARSRIFHSDDFHQRCDGQARCNLSAALAHLV